MSDPVDPTGGWAKAVEETSGAARELTRAAASLGKFVADPARELLGMLTDHLRVVRFERRVRLVDRVAALMQGRGLEEPTRHIKAATLLPLLDFATLEENDDLQDVWARMLVNAGDASTNIELRRAYVSVLADMTAFDVRNLNTIWQSSGNDRSFVVTTYLPESAGTPQQENEAVLPAVGDLAISLGNMVRLGVLEPAMTFGGLSLGRVRLTVFGEEFCRACAA